MPGAAFSLCCQGAEASMPVAETKAPALIQTLGGQAGQSGGPKRRPVFFRRARVCRARGLVRGGSGGSPGPLAVSVWREWHALCPA